MTFLQNTSSNVFLELIKVPFEAAFPEIGRTTLQQYRRAGLAHDNERFAFGMMIASRTENKGVGKELLNAAKRYLQTDSPYGETINHLGLVRLGLQGNRVISFFKAIGYDSTGLSVIEETDNLKLEIISQRSSGKNISAS